MGRPDYIFGQFRETARCRDVQHGDGVCCAFAPQLFCIVLKCAQNDWQLRGTFFDCIVGVAAYVGWQSSIILKPLLQQVDSYTLCLK